MQHARSCPDCDEVSEVDRALNRREFVRRSGAVAAAASLASTSASTFAAETSSGETPEKLVASLYESLTPGQKQQICFDWDFIDQDQDRGLLRTHVSNNWSIVDRKRLTVGGEFFTADQRDMIEAIFFGLYNPDWHDRIRKQLQDDAGGYGKAQTIAIFGDPTAGKYQWVMTGRHCTIRCDGDSSDHVAFGGPIFYGHAAKGFYEEANHPGNVFWPQAMKANSLYQMLDGKQREQALVKGAPYESEVGFRGPDGQFPGIPISELAEDQKGVARDVLATLVEPYRGESRDEALRMLNAQGGLEACSLSFYGVDQDGGSVDVGNDGVWDVWRIEGPSFVWHFRGEPHVHVWVNVADDPSIPLNAAG
ncbi:MAG: DUF3500 domain-containing protein [Planctomycetaceae bacterium]|nr:DUF3500 domain-containing protein [Planctomycetaceae bacterium]